MKNDNKQNGLGQNRFAEMCEDPDGFEQEIRGREQSGLELNRWEDIEEADQHN